MDIQQRSGIPAIAIATGGYACIVGCFFLFLFLFFWLLLLSFLTFAVTPLSVRSP